MRFSKLEGPPNIVILSHGAGIQTSGMLQMIYDGLIEKPTMVGFSDTGNEPSYIYDQVQWAKELCDEMDIPFHIVNNGNILKDLYDKDSQFASIPLFTKTRSGNRGKKQSAQAPGQVTLFDLSEFTEDAPQSVSGFGVTAQFEKSGRMKRQCTYEYKIYPIEQLLRAELLKMGLAKRTKDGKVRVNKGVIVETWIGYTIDEFDRMKPSRHSWQRVRFPLIEKRITHANMVAYLEERGLSFKSSSCAICPIISDRRVMELREGDPENYEVRLQLDDDLRNGRLSKLTALMRGDLYMHESCLPLREVELKKDRPKPGIGCHGFCGT